MPTFATAGGIAANYVVSGYKCLITLRSSYKLNIRAAHSGAADLEFYWVSTGKSSSWVFKPLLVQPKILSFSNSAAEDGGQILSMELDDIFPPVGFLNGRAVGAIRAPAIHFDIPMDSDVWIVLFR